MFKPEISGSSLQFVALVTGSYIFGKLSDVWGRKKSFFLSVVIQVKAAIICVFLDTRGSLFSLGVSVCVHTPVQVENQHCSRTDRVQKNQKKCLGKNIIFNVS